MTKQFKITTTGTAPGSPSEVNFVDPTTKIAFQEGINVYGYFDLSGPFAPVSKFVKTGVPVILGGYFDSENAFKSRIFADLPAGIKIPSKTVSLGPLQFFISGEPPAFGLQTTVIIKPSPQDTPITASASVSFR